MPESLPRASTCPIETLGSRVVFDTPWISVRQDDIRREDGTTGTFGYLELQHDIVVIAPLDADRRVCLVRQWRYPWRRDSWELPAGRCEAGETPLQGAQRELREEALVSAREWRHLNTFYGSASIATPFHLYAATGLTPVESPRDHEEQDMIVTWIPLDEAVDAVMDGRIVHAASIGALLRLDRLVSRGEL
ncbi:MAG TPA: NUDIX hydrolase [Chloroflexota bacterium]|nr:NUDIX hydrolase [Chloroflexota bacterium]